MTHALSRIGASIGNWNDRHNSGDSRTTRRRPRTWQALDRVSSLLYVLPDGWRLARRAARGASMSDEVWIVTWHS